MKVSEFLRTIVPKLEEIVNSGKDIDICVPAATIESTGFDSIKRVLIIPKAEQDYDTGGMIETEIVVFY